VSTDLDRLQGSWRVTAFESDGERMPGDTFADARIVISGDRFTSLGMGAPYEGTLKLHRSRGLKAFDLLFTSGHAQGTRNVGIYKLEGDTWTICLATQSSARPMRFATRAGSGFALETLMRELNPPKKGTNPAKPASAPPAPARRAAAATLSGPPTEIEGEWRMLSATFDGKPMAADMVAWCTRITRGDNTVVMAGPQTMLNARFAVDGSQKPGAIDYVNLHGSAKGKTQLGIYALTGARLTICMSPPGKPRPATFESSPGDGRSLTAWQRVG